MIRAGRPLRGRLVATVAVLGVAFSIGIPMAFCASGGPDVPMGEALARVPAYGWALLAGNLAWWEKREELPQRFAEVGLDPGDPGVQRWLAVAQMPALRVRVPASRRRGRACQL